MTVSNSTYRVSYNGNGSTTSFSIPFYFISNSDILVSKLDTNVSPNVETTLILGTDYNLSGAGDLSGGTLNTIATLVSGEKITIERNAEYTQSTDYEPFGRFPAETLEQNLDKLTMEIQQVKALTDRALLFDRTTSFLNSEIEEPSSGSYLKWDANGNIINGSTSAEVSENYTAPYTGATSRTFTQKLSDFVCPRDFGAVGDGTTDDTTAMQNCFNSGRDIYIHDDDVYLITSKISITSGNRVIFGKGQIKVATTNPITMFEIVGVSGVTIRDVRFAFTGSNLWDNSDGVSNYRNNYAIVMLNADTTYTPCNYLTIDNCEFSECLPIFTFPHADLAQSDYTTARQHKNVKIINNSVDASIATDLAAFSLQYTSKSIMQGNTLTASSNACSGLRWSGGSASSYTDFNAKDIVVCDNVFDTEGWGVFFACTDNVVVDSNIFKNNQNESIDFEGCYRSKASNNTCLNVRWAFACFYQHFDLEFSDNYVELSSASSYMYNQGSIQGTISDYNRLVFRNNTVLCPTTAKPRLQLGYARDLIIEGNTLENVFVVLSGFVEKQIIKDNNFTFTRVDATLNYLIRPSYYWSTITADAGRLVFENNVIESPTSLDAGNSCIEFFCDVTVPSKSYIRYNTFRNLIGTTGLRFNSSNYSYSNVNTRVVFTYNTFEDFDQYTYAQAAGPAANQSLLYGGNVDQDGLDYVGDPAGSKWPSTHGCAIGSWTTQRAPATGLASGWINNSAAGNKSFIPGPTIP